MNGKDIIKLAAEFAAGGISADAIKEHYGEGVLSSVMAIAGGTAVGMLAGTAVDVVDDVTGGLISDVGGVIDDLFGW